MSPQIETALDEIRSRWPKATVTSTEDEAGNVIVLVDPLDIGQQYKPIQSWIGFQLQYNYPDSDVYPHYISPEVLRVDEQPHGSGFGSTDWRGSKVIQISRRTNDWNGAVDTAESKLIKVLDFIRSR